MKFNIDSTLFLAVIAGCAILIEAKSRFSALPVEPTADPPPQPQPPPSSSSSSSISSSSPLIGSAYHSSSDLAASIPPIARRERSQQDELAEKILLQLINHYLTQLKRDDNNNNDDDNDATSSSSNNNIATTFDDEDEEEVVVDAAQSKQQINQQQARSHHNQHNQHHHQQQQQLQPHQTSTSTGITEAQQIEKILVNDLLREHQQQQQLLRQQTMSPKQRQVGSDYMSRRFKTTEMDDSPPQLQLASSLPLSLLPSSPLKSTIDFDFDFDLRPIFNNGNRLRERIRRRRSGISDQKLAEMQMIRALKKQSERNASSRTITSTSNATGNLDSANT